MQPAERLQRDYWCFLSYRHADNKKPGRQWASWLHQALETYEVPAELVGTKNERGEPIPDRIFPVFRDEEELPADAELTRPIEAALRRSRFLVVICSPQAVASWFVEEEILRFKQLGKQDSILAVIIAGEPNASDDAAKGGAEKECFPRTLRFRVDTQGQLTTDRVEPIAADFRLPDGTSGWTTPAAFREALEAKGVPSKTIKSQVDAYAKHSQLMLLKIAAGVLGVPLGDLTRRDQAYQLAQQRLRTQVLRRWLAAVSVLALLAAGTGWLALQQTSRAVEGEKEAELQKNTAIARLARSNYFLANARWKERRIDEAFALLNSIPEEHRKFEWHLARRQFAGSDMTLVGHTDDISSVVFNTDGTRLASIDNGPTKNIKIWDAQTGEMLHAFSARTNELSRQARVAFSPNGSHLIAATTDGTITLWNIQTGDEFRSISLKEPFGFEGKYSLSPDCSLLALGSGNEIFLFDLQTGEKLRSFATGHSDGVHCIAFSPDGTWFASASNTIKLWEVQTGREVRELKLSDHSPLNAPSSHSNGYFEIAFSLDGFRLASTAWDGIQIWDLWTGTVQQRLSGGGGRLAFSPDGTQLVSAGSDKTVKIWEVRTGIELRTYSGHSQPVECLAFSPDSSRLATASSDKTIKLWDVRTGNQFRTLDKGADCIAFSKDGSRLVSARFDTIHLWDMPSCDEIRTLSGHTQPIVDVGFAPDGACIATASEDKTIKLWNSNTGEELRTLSGHKSSVMSVSFTPDGSRLASASHDTTIKIWNMHTGEELRTIKGHSKPVNCVRFSPDGSLLASASWDETIKLWDVLTWEELRTFTGTFSNIAFSPDGSRLAIGGELIKVCDVRTGEEIFTLSGGSGCVVFSPDGTRLASRNIVDKSIVLWDLITGEEIYALSGGSFRDDESLVFSVDGSCLVAGSFDGRITLWEVWSTQGSSDELAYRKSKAKLDPIWHEKQTYAAKNVSLADSYSALFHRAWVLKARPEDGEAYYRLHAAYETYRKDFVARIAELPKANDAKKAITLVSTNPDDYLAPIVREMLKLPRPK